MTLGNTVFNKITQNKINEFMDKTLDFIKDFIKGNDSYKLDNVYNYDFSKHCILNPDIADFFSYSLYEYNYYNKIIRKYDLIFDNNCKCKNIIEVIY